MPDNASDHTNLKTQYAAQVTADLESNAREQERIASEIGTLQSKLGELERDHALLLSMQQALATDPPGTVPGTLTSDTATAGAPSRARLPRARKPRDGAEEKGPKGGRGTKSAKQGAGGRSGRGAKAAADGGKERSGRRSRRGAGTPTLREVVSSLLSGHGQPRSAAEVTTALSEQHPEREVSPTVVRNTLEALVAKGQAHRSKQQKSVFYSSVEPAGGTASTADGDTASGGAAGA
ncbi:hypothetical protein [Streptomyces sp. TS71-3]|uniref:hypothetical protein n=1 Tax=Streptomyces sp. TS71-3 TaxID=2733862 RepID=UPI001AFD4B88|nr:hypothetical protein [Streptomyces sp. TS71-3]GHJ42462.1 hypothetical protein Sm713_80710 [Streptomyces sp. TS71-3]